MEQQKIFEPIPFEELDQLSHEELKQLFKLEQKLRLRLQKDNEELRSKAEELRQRHFQIEEQYITIKNKFFGKSSEKEASPETVIEGIEDSECSKESEPRPKRKKVQLPSLRYPNAPLVERHVTLDKMPSCKCCGVDMQDSGMTEDSEFLTTVPAQYWVIRLKKHKYRCGKCHGDIVTPPSPPRIKPGSGYSDEMAIDVSMAKYCDLIPIERYSSIAGRAGLKDLPPQSLIQQTHYLADFVKGAYDKLFDEVADAKLLYADETPHRMLEGADKESWYLWGFSTGLSSYFEIHDTRSGDVASDLLKKSKCEYLMSDVYSGYNKATRITNEDRVKQHLPKMINIYCNAHARRKFIDAKDKFPDEAKFYIDRYKKIYRLETIARKKPPDRVERVRRLMDPLFKEMKSKAMADVAGYSSRSSIHVAMSYFLKNYDQFTIFVKNRELPIDNNLQERQMRNPVIGRKTWYGTHSIRGAQTTAIIFSLVESCKLVGINPRDYFKNLVQNLHLGKLPYTPKEFKDLHQNH